MLNNRNNTVNILDALRTSAKLDTFLTHVSWIETPAPPSPQQALVRLDYKDLNRDLGMALDVSVMYGNKGSPGNFPYVVLKIDKKVLHQRLALWTKGRVYSESTLPFQH